MKYETLLGLRAPSSRTLSHKLHLFIKDISEPYLIECWRFLYKIYIYSMKKKIIIIPLTHLQTIHMDHKIYNQG